MSILFATLIGLPMSIFGITIFNELKNRKSVRKKSLKKMIPFLGLKSSLYLYSLLSIISGFLSLYAYYSPNEPIVLKVSLPIFFFCFILFVALECVLGIKNISIGNLFSKKEISKFIHLSEEEISKHSYKLSTLNTDESQINFINPLKNGEKYMSMEKFLLHNFSSEKLEKYLEMKLELKQLEELIEEILFYEHVLNWTLVEKKKEQAVLLINSINKKFEEMKEDVGKQTFSKKTIKKIKEDEEKQKEESLLMLKENEKNVQGNDLGLVLLDMKDVSNNNKYSLEDRKQADEFVLRIEKELEKRTKELERNKLNEDIHVLFKTAEMILEKHEHN